MDIKYFKSGSILVFIGVLGCQPIPIEYTENDEVSSETLSLGELDSDSSNIFDSEEETGELCDEPLINHNGQCVECTPDQQESCIEKRQWCNAISHTCEECDTHFQCPNNAGCHLEKKECLSPEQVYHIPADGNLEEILGLIENQNGTIRFNNGAETQILESTVELKENQILALVTAESTRPVIQKEEDFAFHVGTGYLYTWKIDILGDSGIQVDGDGLAYTEKTSFNNNETSVKVSSGRAILRNCMLLSKNINLQATLDVSFTGEVDAVFSTILATEGDYAISCGVETKIDTRNSILGSLDEFWNGIPDGCIISSSGVFIEYPPSLFSIEDFSLLGDGYLHIINQEDFQITAQLSESDPIDDFDNQLRQPFIGFTWPGADYPQL